jgi:superfamily II DNA or RNA helicase
VKIIIETPIKMRIYVDSQSQVDSLRKMLSFKDKTVEMQIKNLKKNFYLRQRYGNEWVENQLSNLNKQLVKTVLFEDEYGLWTYPGLANRLKASFDCQVENNVVYPQPKLIPWNEVPKYSMYYYQEAAVERLLENPHSHVSLPTGSGKSIVITNLVKRLGLKTIVIAPSSSICDQLHEDLIRAFGKKNVGMYGGSKKQYDKKIVVATAQSLVRVTENSESFKYISNFDAMIFDECHLTPANTFEKVCHDLLSKVPYRWFTTATPERNDGKNTLLEAIIGPCVYLKTIQELQEEGFLAKLSTLMIEVGSPNPEYNSNNMVKMNQVHLYNNETIARIISDMAEKAVNAGMPTLILVDEHSQEHLLKKHMRTAYQYASGDSDVTQICEDFNKGKIMCVVGTSAVSTGTNFLPVRLTINWQGNRAGTKVKQGPIGRSTRIHAASGKTEAKIVDFIIKDVPQLRNHAMVREGYYKEVGPVSRTEIT